MFTQKIRIEGKLYKGTTRGDVTTWEPPLPEGYEESKAGNIQEMVDSGHFPGLNTDTTFLANRGTLDKQFGDKKAMEHTIEKAQKSGYNPKPSDVYLSSLARYPGDPEAWISGGDAKGHIRKVCEKRGVGCQGSVNIPEPDKTTDPDEARLKAKKRALKKKATQVAKQMQAAKKQASK